MFRKIKYLIRCILELNYGALFETVGTVHQITKRNRVFLFFDVVYCGLRYGAGHKDYLLFAFYDLNGAQRKTYVTRGVNNSIVRQMNDASLYHLFWNKEEFLEKYDAFANRDWLFLPDRGKEDFLAFMADKDEIIVKPSSGTCGTGVEKLKKADFPDLDAMYDHVMAKQSPLLEEVIVQHPDLQTINPYSVNTLRVITIYSGGKGNVVCAFIRIGNGGRPVDNINAGGMCAPIDLETGAIAKVGYDKDRITYETHPLTGAPILGAIIPLWKEVVEFVDNCAQVTPGLRYVGWDVAVTEKGPVLVEANELPGHDILQMPPHIENKIGMLPRFQQFLK